jgi:hypothetical protein
MSIPDNVGSLAASKPNRNSDMRKPVINGNWHGTKECLVRTDSGNKESCLFYRGHVTGMSDHTGTAGQQLDWKGWRRWRKVGGGKGNKAVGKD